MAAGSTKAVTAAIIGNLLVTGSKLVAFFMTDSGAMLSEAIHSMADVLNQVLLAIGIWLSRRRPDEQHPYGYQTERFIWAMVSAVGIFFLGCGVTGYHGVSALLDPHPITQVGWAYVVLAISLVLEAAVLVIAARAIHRDAAGRPLLSYIRNEADPTAVAVLLEDGVAVTGVIVAAAAIALAQLTGSAIWDGVGSVIIAGLLGGVAVVLVALNRRLLLGVAAPERVRKRVRRIVNDAESVDAIYDFKSRALSVDSYRVKMEVEFDGRVIASRLAPRMREGYPLARESYEHFEAFCRQFADDVIDALGDEIDAIEAKIQAQVPSVKHIDIEAD